EDRPVAPQGVELGEWAPVVPTLTGIDALSTSWPGLSRPSTSCLLHKGRKTWMPATSAGMTSRESYALERSEAVVAPFLCALEIRCEVSPAPSPAARPRLGARPPW